MKANVVGSKALYLNPGVTSFTTGELAAIDTTFAMATISPYAYTATVREDYDTRNFNFDDAGATLAFGNRVAFGLFLSADNSKKNLLWQFSGKSHIIFTGNTTQIHGAFFIGRRATSDTVVSSKAAASNTLAAYALLPHNFSQFLANAYLVQSVETEGFTLELEDGFVYCFGYLIDNVSAATDILMKGGISLAVRKAAYPLSNYPVVG